MLFVCKNQSREGEMAEEKAYEGPCTADELYKLGIIGKEVCDLYRDRSHTAHEPLLAQVCINTAKDAKV